MKFRNQWIKLIIPLSLISFASIFTSVDASEMPFNVIPQLPSNQIDPKAGYLYLKMEPKAQETVHIAIYNTSDRQITVDVEKAGAKTDLNGFVTYMPMENIKNDASLQYDMSNYLKVESKVTLKAHAMANLPVEISMPDQSFDGMMAGGLTFKEENQPTHQDSSNSEGLAVVNNYQYVMAIVTRQNMKIISPDIKLTQVAASQVDARNVVNIGLQNTAKTFANQLALHATITGKDKANKNVKYEVSENQLQMAPNSNFAFPVRLNGEKFVSGHYEAKIDVYAQQSNDGAYTFSVNHQPLHYQYHWSYSKDFDISQTSAQVFNRKDVSISKTTPSQDFPAWLIGLLGMIIAILLFVITLLVVKSRKQKNTALIQGEKGGENE